jgi:2-desacetyl-2-hydroxyethyl bacteriochlorophyllide A dehydrogenase
MRAILKSGPGRGVELAECPSPKLVGAQDVMLEVSACGICGSDVQCYLGEERHLAGMPLPVILGHEVAGTILEVGGDVVDFVPGDRVVVESLAPCGGCEFCRLGMFNHCERGTRLGHTVDGGMAPLVAVPGSALFRIPDSLRFDHAAVLKPLGVALRAFERAPLQPGETVAVIGPGTVGLLAGMIARASGAAAIAIIGLERDRGRLELAASLGLTPVIDDPLDAVRELTGGRGSHLTIDASGGTGTLGLSVELTRPGGSIVLLGISGEERVSPAAAIMKELSIHGSLTRQPGTWQRAIALLAAGVIDVEPLITHRIALEEVEAAFEALVAGEGVKYVLEPNGGS